MHYGTAQQKLAARLELIIYTHAAKKLNEAIDKVGFYEITSIQKCEYIEPKTLEKIFRREINWKNLLGKLRVESWYHVTIGADMKIMRVIDVTHVEDESLVKLHYPY